MKRFKIEIGGGWTLLVDTVEDRIIDMEQASREANKELFMKAVRLNKEEYQDRIGKAA